MVTNKSDYCVEKVVEIVVVVVIVVVVHSKSGITESPRAGQSDLSNF